MWPCFCETNASLPGLMAVAVILSEVSSCLSEIFWSIRHGCEVRNVFLSWERSYKSKETRSVFWVESLPEAPYIPSENSQLQILKKKKNNFFFSSQFWNLFPNPSIGTESMAACFSLFTGLCLASVWKCEGRWICLSCAGSHAACGLGVPAWGRRTRRCFPAGDAGDLLD